MGINYENSDLFGVSGVGKGAMGYYRNGDDRHRVAALIREDEAGAKDVMGTLKKLPGAKVVKDATFDAVAFPVQDGEDSKVEWVAGRKGKSIVALGDEAFSLATDAGAKLTFDAKLSRVKASLDAL
jgi:hypothetical protein